MLEPFRARKDEASEPIAVNLRAVMLDHGDADVLTAARALELQVGAGFTLANSTHLNSYYGVPESAGTATRPAYSPSAGLKDAGVGVRLTSELASHWVAFAGLRYTRLLEDSADSPLALHPSDVAATVGIAWRCCR